MLLGVLVFVACGEARASAATPRLAPPWLCTEDNNLEIFVDEDLIMYACECRQLVDDLECNWQVIGGVDDPSTYRRLRRLAERAHVVPRLVGKRRVGVILRRYHAPLIVTVRA